MATEDAQLRSTIQTKLEQSGEYDRCARRAHCRRRGAPPNLPCRCRLKAELRQKLIDSGWRDQLKSFTMGACKPTTSRGVRVAHPGPVSVRCADLIRQKGEQKGDAQMTVQQLTEEITPRGRGVAGPDLPTPPASSDVRSSSASANIERRADLRLACALAATVPDEVKAELLQRIRNFVETQS